MYQALYRKYRPTVFDDVCGQEHITSVLKYQTENERVSHAYLFCGSRGTGKTTCAKILAKAVNCENPKGGNPCCECPSCRAIDSASAPDVLEMDAASNNGVDYIRDIRDEVSYTPAMLKRRVYIIDEVHMLSTSAFNALLKTLEEPPEHVVFILATTEMHKLPTTIVSRCQRFDFRRISLSVLTERLMYIAKIENILLEEEAAQQIARQAQGGMRDAINLFELCSGGGADVTIDRVRDILGLSSYAFLHDAVLSLSHGDIKAMFSVISDVVASSKDITVFWQELTSFYRDMMVGKYADEVASYLDLTSQECALLLDAADKFNIKTLTYHCGILDQAFQAMLRAPQMKRTIAEFACIRMCEPALDQSTESLLARIGQLEDRIALIEIGASSAPIRKEKSGVHHNEPKKVIETISERIPEKTHINNATDEFEPVPDISEVIEKIGRFDKRAQSFLLESAVFVSPDGMKARICAATDFAAKMLSDEKSKASVANALALCKVTAGTAEIIVEVKTKELGFESAAEDLYNSL